LASLSWEVVWQIKSTLALGVSAWGTAVTLAVTMGGMGLGGFLMGRFQGVFVRALAVYGVLESIIGLSGLLLNRGFHLIAEVDRWAYAGAAVRSPLVHILGIVLVLGIPTVCMGATIPVFARLSRQFQVPIAELYGLNTLGAAAGSMVAAFGLIPLLGITNTMGAIAGLNLAVGVSALLLDPGVESSPTALPAPETSASRPVVSQDAIIVFVTGFATFTLEIAWFRSLSATFLNTSDVFASMLACMLVALGWASRSVPKLRQRQKSLGGQLCLAGLLVLVATPLIEWLDILWMLFRGHFLPEAGLARPSELLDPVTFAPNGKAAGFYLLGTSLMILFIGGAIVPPVKYLGVAFPWILDEQKSSRQTGVLYALNTLGAILGAIIAAWVLLPAIGFARTAWIAGVLVLGAGLWAMPAPNRRDWFWKGAVALLVAAFFGSGVGRTRVQGYYANMEGMPAKILESLEGPDATASVVEYRGGGRRLIIDSSSASGQSGSTDKLGEHYMNWMGHLPMLLHPDPRRALVICFGTGQTANSVRRENPVALDIVDINPRIFKLARHFTANKDVLHDSRVRAIVMDGRAYARRTTNVYDVITLEPMPPTAAGVNALYSREFYELARGRLGDKGVIAQWLPYYCVSPLHAASIARTFMEVFPNAVLWIDPDTKNDGILLGTRDSSVPLGTVWPGFVRTAVGRDLNEEQARRQIVLDVQQLRRYAAFGQVITDDNQLLAYGKSQYCNTGLLKENFELLRRANAQVVVP
jgi:predicted membrane-bound spermidine synthase